MKRIARRFAFICPALLALGMLCMPALCASESTWMWVGPWHLDDALNDLTAFDELFPGYSELDAGMEIRSSGQMSWFIGADGGYGTYAFHDSILRASLISDAEQEEALMELCFVPDEPAPLLEMPLGELTVFWRYGDREDELPE